MLHLSGRIAFGVDVRNFLELEGALQRDRIVNPPAEIEKVGIAEKLPGQLLDLLVALQNALHLLRELGGLMRQRLRAVWLDGGAGLRQVERRQVERGELP